MKEEVAIIIPAYNPNEQLLKLISDLVENEYRHIIVINDGSENREIFEKIGFHVVLLEHAQNRGKGRALKTGINYVIENIKLIKGIITVDADGQHIIENINNVYETFTEAEDCVVLGSRNFDKKEVPFRSRLGNKVMTYLLKKKYNLQLKDTQTGLRAISQKYLKEILFIQGEGFEYEMNVILYFIRKQIPIIEIPIESVYINKNKSSHYRVIKDSLKIYQSIRNKES